MPRDLKLTVDGDSGGGQRALEAAAAAADLAAREANKLGKQFKQAERDAASLDRQLLETAAAAKVLAKELANNPADAGIKKQLEATRKQASELKAIRQDIIGDSERAATAAARTADKAAKEFSKLSSNAAKDAEKVAAVAKKEFEDLVKEVTQSAPTLGEMFSKGPGGLLSPPGLVIGGATATVGGAALGGLTAVGAGAAVAGAGVAGAALGDPVRFGAAWGDVVSKLKKQFLDATSVFSGPGLDAIHSIDAELGKWDFKGLFAAAVPYVEPLVSGAETAARYIFEGVETLTRNAGPAIDVFSTDLGDIGKSINESLSLIASQAQGGADGLHAIDQAIEDTIVAVGLFVASAEAITGAVKGAAEATRDYFDRIPTWLQVVLPWLALYRKFFDLTTQGWDTSSQSGAHYGRVLDGVTASSADAAEQAAVDDAAYEKLAAQFGLTTVKASSLVDGVNQIFGALLSADHATLGWHESLTGLQDSLKQNGNSLDENNAKGQANVEKVLSSIEANERLYESNIASGKGIDFATNAYDKNERALENTLKQAGVGQQVIDGLTAKYRSVPDTVKTNIQLKGITDAINDLDDVLRRVNGLPPRKTINIVVNVGGQLGLAESLIGAGIIGGAAPKHKAFGDIRHAATGLIVGPRDPGTLIGEPQTGGEALIPLRGISRARAGMLAQTAVSGYGLDVVPRGPRVPANLFGGGGVSTAAPTVNIAYAGSGRGLEGAFYTWFAQALRTGELSLTVDPGGQVKAA